MVTSGFMGLSSFTGDINNTWGLDQGLRSFEIWGFSVRFRVTTKMRGDIKVLGFPLGLEH